MAEQSGKGAASGRDAKTLEVGLRPLLAMMGRALLASPQSKVLLVAGVTADQTTRIKAGELVGSIAAAVGGKGGGRADFAQAGGSNAAALPQALASVADLVRKRLGA